MLLLCLDLGRLATLRPNSTRGHVVKHARFVNVVDVLRQVAAVLLPERLAELVTRSVEVVTWNLSKSFRRNILHK